MTYILPSQQTKEIKQPNSSDLAGSLFVTKNINLDTEGYMKLSAPAVAIMTNDDDSDFDNVDALNRSDGAVFFNGGDVFSETDIDYSTFTNRSGNTGVPSPGPEEDVVYFNDTEVISDGANIYYRSASTTWTSVSTSLSATNPTSMCVFNNLNSLIVGNNNTVKLVNTSWAVSGTVLTLAPEYIVTSVESYGDLVYIGTRHTGGGEARLFLWDGAGTTFSASYGVGSYGIFSVKSYGSSVALVTTLGQLLRFNGGGFDVLANLPAYYLEEEWADANNDYSRISNRGMVVDGDLIYLRLDSSFESNRMAYNAYFPGGVWCYDPKVGLYHRTSPSYTRITQDTIATTDVNTSTDVITVTSAPETGTPCLYDDAGSTAITGLENRKLYYVIQVSSTTIKLATSKTNADAGTAIDLTGTGNNSQFLLFYPPNDYGWAYADNRGSVTVMESTMFDDDYASRILFTANMFSKTNNGTAKTAACSLSKLLPNRGYLITPRLYSSEMTENYNKLFIKAKPLNTDDEIVVKYKTTDKLNFPIHLSGDTTNDYLGTWFDTDTFTTTRDLSNVEAGDEIEIVAGVGAGFTAHVSSISESSGTYTVNLDEAFTWATANDVMYFVVDNWTKKEVINSSTKTNALGYFEVSIDKIGSFAQFKLELRGVEVTLVELQVLNKNDIRVV